MSTTGQCYYKAARDEIVMRLRMRDQILLSFIISTGAIFGITLSNINENGPITLVIPFLSFGTSILVSAHTRAMTNILLYVDDLAPAINNCRASKIPLYPWDSSEEFRKEGKNSSFMRFLGNSVVILTPAIYSLVFTYKDIEILSFSMSNPKSSLWNLDVILIVLSVIFLYSTHMHRKEIIFTKNAWSKKDKN